MKRVFIALILGFAVLATFDSCSKTGAEMVVGRWESWSGPEYLEFEADGKMSVWRYGMIYEGSYQVEGPNIVLDFGGRTVSGSIRNIGPDRLSLEMNDESWMDYTRREEPFPVCTWTNTGPTISVTGDTWFILDHQYNPGEEIHLENVTFGLYNAIDWNDWNMDRLFQTLFGCYKVDGRGSIITQNVELPNSFGEVSKVCYRTNSNSSAKGFYSYEHSTSHGYILYNTDVVISDYEIYLNDHCFADGIYLESPLDMNVHDCLFAGDESGSHVVQNQTASCGTITFTKNGTITAQYTPTLDDNGTPCFYNSVSGEYIYHSGGGTPIYHPGF